MLIFFCFLSQFPFKMKHFLRYQPRQQTAVMDWTVLWLTFTLALWAYVEPMTSASSSVAQQRFVAEPQNQTVIVGTKVVLPCRVKDKSGELQWTRNFFGLGDKRNLPGFPRYTMIGKDEEGNFSLEIDPVSLEDNAVFECQVMGGKDQPVLRSRSAHLTVLVPSEPPRIVQGSTLETIEQIEIKLECVSAAGKPPAQISWLVADSGELTNGIEDWTERLDSELYTTRSVLKLTATKHHHQRKFVCRSKHVAEQFARSTAITLEVQYAPSVVLSVIGQKLFGGILENSDAYVFCHVDANPSVLSYSWFINGKQIMDTTKELVLTNVGRSLHGMAVSCQASNMLGKSEAWDTLNITYGPRFRTKPLPFYSADPGSAVTMTCDAEGRPTPDIKWYFIHADLNRDEMEVGTSPNLTVIANSDQKGRYYCKARVDGFPEVVAETELFLHGKPQIFSIRSQFTPSEVLVECEAISLPYFDRVTWSHNGKELPKHDADYDIVEDLFPTGVKTVLHIRDSQKRTAGLYNCSVTNSHGTDSISILLVARPETFPMLIVVTGLTGGCVVLIGVTVGAVLCWRCKTPSAAARTGKPSAVGDSEKDELCRQTSDLSSNISVMNLNLPPRSVMSRPLSETDSERVIEDLSPAKPDQRNNTYVSYDEVSVDDISSFQTNDKKDECHSGNLVSVDNSTLVDVNIGLPTSRSASLTPADSRYVPPYGMPWSGCLTESQQILLPPLHTKLARTGSTFSSGRRRATLDPTPPTQSFRPPCNITEIESALQVTRLPDTTPSHDASPSFQTDISNDGTLATVV